MSRVPRGTEGGCISVYVLGAAVGSCLQGWWAAQLVFPSHTGTRVLAAVQEEMEEQRKVRGVEVEKSSSWEYQFKV